MKILYDEADEGEVEVFGDLMMIVTLTKLMLMMMAPRLGAISTGGLGLHPSRANLDVFNVSCIVIDYRYKF